MQLKPFQHIAGHRPAKSAMNLSYYKIFDGDMGYLYPVVHDMLYPGDLITLRQNMIIRLQPLVSPCLHEINVDVQTFFVPCRLLYSDWEEYITGGEDGTSTPTLPRWNTIDGVKTETQKGTLWDYLGLPVDTDPDGAYPHDLVRRAYYKIWNDYYRAVEIQTEYDITDQSNYELALRNWPKDYFTAMLLSQQRGTPPALPITGSSSAVWAGPSFDSATAGGAVDQGYSNTAGPDAVYHAGSVQRAVNAATHFNDNTVDLSAATAFDIADLRTVVQVQRFLERNSRAGARYTEHLAAHFGIKPQDSRLQRSEFISAFRSPIIISEVLQTESSDASTPQGTLAGHGIAVNSDNNGRYHAKEHGILMSLLSIIPKPLYQQGINRQWLREVKEDWYWPEFANLSEQGVELAEIYATDTAGTGSGQNNELIGYIGNYDEMRYKPSMVCGEMRDTFDYWHISRQFSSAPTLTSSFLECDPRKDIFAVPAESGFIIQIRNQLHAMRPMPAIAEPGFMDH